MPPQPPAHDWYTPDVCASMLGARKNGHGYRGTCPVHGGDNPSALHIYQFVDARGNAATGITCHTKHCTILEFCAYLGIELHQLFSIRPEHDDAMKSFPPARSPRLARLKTMDEPSPDEIALLLILDDIATAPQYVTESTVEGLDGTQVPNPERTKMWELAQARPQAKAALTKALAQSGFIPTTFWQALADEQRD